LSYAGRLGLLWLVLAAVLCTVYRRWGVLLLTFVAVALADWTSMAIKALVHRPRPPLRYPEPTPLVPVPHDGSFPSGHAATSFAAATMLSFAFPTFAPALLILAAAVALSRVYVGVHYPLDVIGGAALGALTSIALLTLVRTRRPATLDPTKAGG
jgi:undecaprenyl-diphosphatase